MKSLLLLKRKRQRRGEGRRREAGGGRVTRGILARGMTSQQVPGAPGKCDLTPSNAQTTHHRLEKGRQRRNEVFFGTCLLQQGQTELSAAQVAGKCPA